MASFTSNVVYAPLLGKISSRLEDLDVLHGLYPWIPSSLCIRPCPETLEIKKQKLEDIERCYVEFVDYFYAQVFGKVNSVRDVDGKLFVVDRNVRGMKIFQPNLFPYQLGGEGRHWVMWYGDPEMKHADHNDISKDIHDAIHQQLGGSSRFNFAWYENPKMTVPEFFHVQVFWSVF